MHASLLYLATFTPSLYPHPLIQLDPLLRSSGFANGDANEADGFSAFPGNINQLIMDLDCWRETVETSTGGAIAEFINPKYTDGTRTQFKSPTRLECMMQDFVKTVPSGQRVAWTRYPQWLGYFPCKNDIVSAAKLCADGVPPHSASSAEMAVYHLHAQMLRTLGATVAAPAQRTFRGVDVEVGPAVVLAPSFAPCFTLLAAELPTPRAISIAAGSTLLVRGDAVRIEQLTLSGALVIEVEEGGSLTIKSLTVSNAGWEFTELSDAEAAAADETIAIRGYQLTKHDARVIRVKAGESILIEAGVAKRQTVTNVSLDAKRRGGSWKAQAKAPPGLQGVSSPVVIQVEPERGACPSCTLL